MDFYGDQMSDQQLRDAIAVYNGGAPAPYAAAQDVTMAAPAPPAALMPPSPEIPPPPMPPAAPAAPRIAAPQQQLDPYQQAQQATERNAAIQADAARGASEARARAGEQKSDVLERLRTEMGASTARKSALRQDYQGDRERRMGEYTRMADEAANMSAHDRRTRSQKVMGALAVGIGNIADGLAAAGATYAGGGPGTHYAQQISDAINLAVERDLDEQRETITAAKDKSAARLLELGMAREYFQDDVAAEEWTAEALREQYGIEMQEQAATLESEVARQEGMAVGAQIQQDASNRKLQIWESREDMRMKRAAASRAAAGGKKGMDWGTLTRAQLESLSAAGALPADGQVVLDKLRGPEVAAAQHEATRNQMGDKDLRTRLDRVGDNVQKIAAAQQAVRELLPYQAGAKGLPTTATGITGLLTPDRMVSSEGRHFKGQLKGAQNAFLRMATGAGATESEAKRQWEEFGLREDLNQSEQSIVDGLNALATRTSELEQVIKARDPEAYDLYERNRSGTSPGAVNAAGAQGGNAMQRLKGNFGFRPKGAQ